MTAPMAGQAGASWYAVAPDASDVSSWYTRPPTLGRVIGSLVSRLRRGVEGRAAKRAALTFHCVIASRTECGGAGYTYCSLITVYKQRENANRRGHAPGGNTGLG